MSEIKPYCHQVQYYETDMMGVAHHSNYICWMEEPGLILWSSWDFLIVPWKQKACSRL